MSDPNAELDESFLDEINFDDEYIQAVLRGDDLDPQHQSATSSEVKSHGANQGQNPLPSGSEGVCQDCGDTRYSKKFYATFGQYVCFNCLKGSKYQLASKTTLKKDYLLTDEEIDIYLPFISQVNPNHPTWSAMKLYLRSSAREIALRRFGSEAGIEEEKRKRELHKMESAIKRTRQKRQDDELRKRVQLGLERRYAERGETTANIEDELKTSALILNIQLQREKQKQKQKSKIKQNTTDDDSSADEDHQDSQADEDNIADTKPTKRGSKRKATTPTETKSTRGKTAIGSSSENKTGVQLLASDAARLREAASKVHLHNYVVLPDRPGVKVCDSCGVTLEYEEL